MSLLQINPQEETERIVEFLKKTFKEQKVENAVIGLSGGIDSAVSLYLLARVIPKENIFVTHLSYFPPETEYINSIIKPLGILEENISFISIKPAVDALAKTLTLKHTDSVRKGNIMARMRMIMLYDLAKKNKAMVCGTENKSEHLLAYFTKFGDAASDIEPIVHLYKTQVYQLASYLGIPQETINRAPSANLWSDQSDEKELGFTYKEADQVLSLYYDKKVSLTNLSKKFPNAKKIIEHTKKVSYKLSPSYSLFS